MLTALRPPPPPSEKLVRNLVWWFVLGSGDGNVDDKEFERALDVLGVQARKKDVCAIMNFLDQNGDGMIQAGAMSMHVLDGLWLL